MHNDGINDNGKVTLPQSQTLTEEQSYRCSFCSKDVNEVFMLVAGPAVFICDECIEKAQELVHAKKEEQTRDS